MTARGRERSLWGALLASALVATGSLGACGNDNQPTVGTNTNWLRACDENAQCGDELSCECGVCTTPCSDERACADLDTAASCQDPSSASLCEGASGPICDVSCSDDVDCEYLDEGACVGGRCRAFEPPEEEEVVRLDEVICAARTDHLDDCGDVPAGGFDAIENQCLEEQTELRLVRSRFGDRLYECVEELPCNFDELDEADCAEQALLSLAEDITPADLEFCSDARETCADYVDGADFSDDTIVGECLEAWRDCGGEPVYEQWEPGVCLSVALLHEIQRQSVADCFEKDCDVRLDCLEGLGAFDY